MRENIERVTCDQCGKTLDHFAQSYGSREMWYTLTSPAACSSVRQSDFCSRTCVARHLAGEVKP